MVESGAARLLFFERGLLLLQMHAARLGGGPELDDLLFQLREAAADLRIMKPMVAQHQMTKAPREFFVAQGLGRLAAE